MPTSTSLLKLKAIIGVTLLVSFWRRMRSRRPLDLHRSLSRRWTASSLQAVLSALSPLSPRLRHTVELPPPSSGQDSPVGTPPQPSLSRTWSPATLGRLFQRFRVGSDAGIAPRPVNTPHLTTWCEFQEDSLHHPEWGYYSDGRVVFGESADDADFTTFPVTMRPAFGAMLADRLHALWLETGAGTRPFVVCELGAGTGVLAHDVLSHAADNLPAFFAVLRYVIGERSHALRALQEATNARFVGEGKLTVVPADARDLPGSGLRQRLLAIARTGNSRPDASSPDATELCGAIVSNELPDAFGVERVLVGMRSAAEGAGPGTVGGATVGRATVGAVGARRGGGEDCSSREGTGSVSSPGATGSGSAGQLTRTRTLTQAVARPASRADGLDTVPPGSGCSEAACCR